MRKTESCPENLWNDIQLKGNKDRNRHYNRVKKKKQEWASSASLCKILTVTSQLREGAPAGLGAAEEGNEECHDKYANHSVIDQPGLIIKPKENSKF